jgi:A/G-specific adenine glycosylase
LKIWAGELTSRDHKQSAPSSVQKYRVTVLAGRELASFRKRLLAWFRQFQRDLPWRRTKDPYQIWISEIMLQQTRVAAVIPYYEKFLARFHNVRALAQAPEEEVLKLWSGLGYYSRARNLQKAAQQIMARHSGQFPREESEVLALPGIGRYTAAAILSIAFGAEHAVLDGNVARVLARLGALRGDLRESRRWQSLQKTASRRLESGNDGTWGHGLHASRTTMSAVPRAEFLLRAAVGRSGIVPREKKETRLRASRSCRCSAIRSARPNAASPSSSQERDPQARGR